MTTKQMLQNQYGLVYSSVGAHVEGMTQEESLMAPEAGGNCANWILGHLTNVQNNLMQLMGAEPVWVNPKLDRDWNDPINGPEEAFDFSAMRDAFMNSQDRCLSAIASLSDEQLAQDGIPNPLGGTTTRDGLLALLAFHQTYHTGQLALARRVAGHPGVFKQPGS